ncbi:MAG: hypothetical protein IKS45_09465, partial [Thermoguttaceae bacterium]|nr:hypothetical protein [Thermoguttaceae bacterium]
FNKSIRRIEQLYYPFTMADYSLDMLLEDKNVVENINAGIMNRLFFWSGISSNKQTSNTITQANFPEDENKVKFCQLVLLELGQEVLAKRADWLLAVTDRDLQKPK